MYNKKLADRLKELRKINGFNQEYVASYLYISRQAYSHYETGRSIPPTDTLVKLAQLYQLPAEELLALSSSVLPASHSAAQGFDELDRFFDFFNDPRRKKYLALDKSEKLLLYFFHQLCAEDQEDLLEFLKIRSQRMNSKN